MSQSDALARHLLAQQERAATLEAELTALPALGPENGGEGEAEKAAFIEGLLAACKIEDVYRLDSQDPRVACGFRPNIVARVPGESPRTLWIFGHMDVVPAGDPAAWSSDPWHVRREGDLIHGRGVEDNQQAVTGMLLLAEALAALGLTPRQSLGLVFMADEECGSRHGLAHVLDTEPGRFSPEDWYLVPDAGSPSGDAVEMAEKGQLWLKVLTEGKQCHASTPEEGVNAFLAGAEAAVALHDGLATAFPERDALYRPPVSTFEPTRHEANVDAVNILPGRDVFWLDCRLLPAVAAEAVLARAREIAAEVAARRGVRIEVEVEHTQAPSLTRPDLPSDAPLFPALADAVEAVYHVRPRPVGIGGATVAALLRARGLPAVVWSRIFNTCHQPDERASLAHICGDAAVFGRLLMAHAPRPGSQPAHA